MIGFVIFAHLNTYKVKVEGKVFDAISINKLKDEKIFVGDKVEISISDFEGREDKNLIIEVFPRRNYFLRPRVANVDNAIIVISTIDPKFNDYHLDKLITFFQFQNVKPIIIFTKLDLNYDDIINQKIDEYISLGYSILKFSNKFSKSDIEFIKKLTQNKVSVFTGNTGVGKTTMTNYLSNDLNLKTQEISKFLKRGRHTTTNLTIYELFPDSYFIDTPGFSIFNSDMDKTDISHNFLTFSKYLKDCKYSNCLHINEVGCNIKGRFSKDKYENYLKFLKEIE